MPPSKTKQERDDEEAARGAALLASWEAAIRDPDSVAYSDPVWNPRHPRYRQVQALLATGLTGGQAQARDEWLAVFDVVQGASSSHDGSIGA